MNVIIVGCTKVGINLATELGKTGDEVAVIDRNARNFCGLPALFGGITVEGTPVDTSTLEKAGIAECDSLAAVTDDDNTNIVVAQLAKKMYHVGNVVVRITDPVRERVFENIGLKTICPTNLESVALLHAITDESFDSTVRFGTTKASFTSRADEKYTGLRVCDVPLFKGEILYAVMSSDGEISLADDRGRIIESGDRLIFSFLVD